MTPDLQQQLNDLEDEFSHWIRTDIARAFAISVQMLQLAEEAGPGDRALSWRAYGNALRAQGKLSDALQAMTRAQKLFEEAGSPIQWARTITGTIPVLVQLDRYKQAISASEEALAVFLGHQEYLAAARLLTNMGALYGNMGRSHDALDCFTRGEELAARAHDRAQQARLNLNRALVLQQLGRHRESLSPCARALHAFLRTGERVSMAKALQSGAIGTFHLGQFGKALRRFARVRALFASASAQRDVAVCDLYISACYVELNRCEEALTRLRSVFGAFTYEQAGFQRAWARLYEGMALVRLGRSGEALVALQQAHSWFSEHGQEAWGGRALLEEADVRLERGETREAIESAARAARLFAAARMPVDEARAYLVAASANLRLGRVRAARRAADRAYPVFVSAQVPGPIFRCLHLLGRIALAEKNWEGARRYLTRAVRTAERVRATVQLPFRRAFLEDKAAAYADLVELHLDHGRVREAHRLADQAKSRALVNLLAVPRTGRRRLIPPGDLDLLAEIEATRREYQLLTAPAQPGPEVAVVLRSKSSDLVAERLEVERRLTALWDEWELRQTANVRPRTDGEQSDKRWFARLPESGAMVEYFIAESRLVAFVSDRRGLRGWADLGSVEGVRRDLELLQLNLDTTLVTLVSNGRVPPGLSRNARALLSGLYDRLWAPLHSLLGKKQRAVIVPHGILHVVPFEALFDGEEYLISRMELSLAPSRAAWLRCQELADRPATGPDLVIGYNAEGSLPFVDEEARRVAASLGTVPYLGAEATVERLREAGSRRLVHVAVHGEFREDNPNFSTLLLADGTLVAADAARLHLDAALVVLSGCETGLSRVTRGEELMGMISAFLQAGCESVLASRWRVDDRITAELMQRFYAGLLSGQSKAASLRGAQMSMAAGDTHPLCWAAFGLVGHSGFLG